MTVKRTKIQTTDRHVNATKLYLHFGRFAGDAILCSHFFCFFISLRRLASINKSRITLTSDLN